MATKVEALINPDVVNGKGLPRAYEVRLLTGLFVVGDAVPDSASIARKLEDNSPTAAYEFMHNKWNGVRREAWKDDRREKDEKVRVWAESRAKATQAVLQSRSISQDLLEGLKVIGLSIEDNDPDKADVDDLRDYYVSNFYVNYAGDKEHSVNKLGNAFYESSFRTDRRDGKPGVKKAEDVMRRLKATKDILAPILEEDTFTILCDVVQARIDNGLGKVKADHINQPMSGRFEKELDYFKTQEAPQPVLPVVPSPAKTAIPTTLGIPVAPEPITRAPAEHIITTKDDYEETFDDLNDKLKPDRDKRPLKVVFPDRAIIRHIIESASDDIDVIELGTIERDSTRANTLNIDGLTIHLQGQPEDKTLTFNFTLDNNGQDNLRMTINSLLDERNRNLKAQAQAITERGWFMNISRNVLSYIEEQLDPEVQDWNPRKIRVGKDGIEVEMVSYAPLSKEPVVSSVPPPKDEVPAGTFS